MKNKKQSILLIEPGYKCKYPPLGLMKISSFHKQLGDEVCFIKGLNPIARKSMWDRVYISTLFSYYWDQTVRTIKYYEYSVKDPQNLFIGGPMATIMSEEIEKETGFKPVRGLLNEKGKLRLKGDHLIDGMIPDYDMLNDISYKYFSNDAYYTYATRGCIRKCSFCAVPLIEPTYQNYIPLETQIKIINKNMERKRTFFYSIIMYWPLHLLIRSLMKSKESDFIEVPNFMAKLDMLTLIKELIFVY